MLMPQGPVYLHKMFGTDGVALRALDKNFNVNRGSLITPKDPDYTPNHYENMALDYLFLEWDYVYEGK